MTNLRSLLTMGAAAVLLVLATAGPADAQLFYRRSVNPWTGGSVAVGGSTNSWTGTTVRGGRVYNPRTGRTTTAGVVYNPWTGQRRWGVYRR